jgi:hypothetical protein
MVIITACFLTSKTSVLLSESARFYVLMAVIEPVKSIIFWKVMPCGLVEFYRRFRRTDCPHLQGRRVSRKNKELFRTTLHGFNVPYDSETKQFIQLVLSN